MSREYYQGPKTVHPSKLVEQSFPEIRGLTQRDARQLWIALMRRAGFGGDPGGRALRLALLEESRSVERTRVEEGGFDLAAVAAGVGLKPWREMFVNGDDFATVHRVRSADPVRDFDHIWYLGPDVLDSLSWVLSVDHGSYLRLWRPPVPDGSPSDDRPA